MCGRERLFVDGVASVAGLVHGLELFAESSGIVSGGEVGKPRGRGRIVCRGPFETGVVP